MVVRHLPRPVDPASGNVAAIDGDGRTFGTSPLDQAIAECVTVRAVCHDLVEKRRHIGRGAGIEERAVGDPAITAHQVGKPINGFAENKHGASFRENTGFRVQGGVGSDTQARSGPPTQKAGAV